MISRFLSANNGKKIAYKNNFKAILYTYSLLSREYKQQLLNWCMLMLLYSKTLFL